MGRYAMLLLMDRDSSSSAKDKLSQTYIFMLTFAIRTRENRHGIPCLFF